MAGKHKPRFLMALGLAYLAGLVPATAREPAMSRAEADNRCHRAEKYIQENKLDLGLQEITAVIQDWPQIGYFHRVKILCLIRKLEYEKALAEADLLVAQAPRDYIAHCERALTLRFLTRYADAVKEYKTATALAKTAKEKSQVLSAIGTCLNQNDKIDEAVEAHRQAVALYPTAEGMLALGCVYLRQNKFDLAMKWADKAGQLEPKYGKVHMLRADIYRVQKQLKKALVEADLAVASDANHCDYLASRAIVLHLLHRYKEAIADTTKVIKLQPFNDGALITRAECYHELGRLEEALTDLNAAMKWHPQFFPVYDRRCKVYISMGNIQAALADARSIGKWFPKDDPVSAVAQAIVDLLPDEEARAALAKLIKLYPDNAAVYATRARWLFSQADLVNARKDWNLAIAKSTEPDNYLIGLAELEFDAKNTPGAITQINKVIAGVRKRHHFTGNLTRTTANPLRGTLQQAYYFRSKLYHNLGRLNLALADMTQVANADPSFYNGRAGLLEEMGRPAEAIADYSKVLAVKKSTAALAARARLYYDSGQYKNAVQDLDQLIRLEPDQSEHYYRRSEAYFKLGNQAAGSKDLAQAEKLSG